MEEKPLQEWRKAKYWSQSTLAKKAGFDRALINRIESGVAVSFRLETMKAIADALEVDPKQITEFRRILPNITDGLNTVESKQAVFAA